MKKKLLAVLLAAAMTLSLAACGGETSASASQEPTKTAESVETSTEPATPADTDQPDADGMLNGKFVETKHISVELYDRAVDAGTDAGNNAWTQWIQQQMLDLYNVEVEFVTVSRWDEVNAINNLLAAGDAPDICYTYSYDTILTYADMGGVTDLAPYLSQYKDKLSNLWTLLGDANIYLDLDPSTGILWAIEGKRAETCRINTFVRQDWLDTLGLAAPTTKAEFEAMLVAFKDNAETLLGADADKMVPYSVSYDIGWRAATLIDSFMDPAISDKELFVNGYDDRKLTQNGTKEAVRLLNKWYNAGLIWKDFAVYGSGDTTEDDMIKAGFVGAFTHNYDYPFRNGADSINAMLAATYGPQAKFVAVDCFEDKNGGHTKYSYSTAGDRKSFFPATNDEPLASLLYLDFISDAKTIEFLQIGNEGVNHEVLDSGAIALISASEENHDWYQNSGKNIDMTMTCNGLYLSTPELTTESLAYSYSNVDVADVKQAIAVASNDAVAPKDIFVGTIEAQAEAAGLNEKRDVIYDNAVVAAEADFDAVWDQGIAEYLAAGGQDIMDERLEKWEAKYGSAENAN